MKCESESCGQDHHHHKHNCCDSQSKEEHCDTGCKMTNKMVVIADKAWESLMLEKMKKVWESNMGEKMDKVAQASVEVSMAYWGNVMKGHGEVAEATKKVQEAMMEKP